MSYRLNEQDRSNPPRYIGRDLKHLDFEDSPRGGAAVWAVCILCGIAVGVMTWGNC